MTLYLYRTGTDVPVFTIENVTSYTDNQAVTEGSGVYGPFAEDVEFSSKEDCSEALRAKWRREHPSAEERVEELEALVAELLFGGNPADGGEGV